MIVGRLGVVLVLGVALVVAAPPGSGVLAAAEQPWTEQPSPEGDRSVDAVLARAVTAADELRYVASVTVITLGSTGVSLASSEVERGEDGVRVRPGAAPVRGGDPGSLRSPTRLLRVAGVEPWPDQLDRLRRKYALGLGEHVHLDTGLAVPVTLTERHGDRPCEILYADADTGLIVRRETFAADGEPVRLVAVTALQSATRSAASSGLPAAASQGVSEASVGDVEVAGLRAAGFLVPASLPRSYDLLTAVEVPAEPWPTLHLLYGDGLHTLSVFQQRGRLDRDGVAGARSVTTPAGGTVWSWPGAEPRRLVWGGGDRTFTALSDAPLEELLLVVDALPVDPAPGVWARIVRGLERVGSAMWPW